MDKFLIFTKNNVRIIATNVLETAKFINKTHETTPMSKKALTTAMTAFIPLGLLNKYGKTTAVINGSGLAGTIIVDTKTNGATRATITNPKIYTDAKHPNNNIVKFGIGETGNIKVIRELRNGNNFSSSVKIVDGNLSKDLAYYFDQSDQIYSSVKLVVELDKEGEIIKAHSLIMQLMPDFIEDDREYIIDFHKKIISELTFKELVNKINLPIKREEEIFFKCTCSRAKMKSSIRLLKKEEIEDELNKNKKINIHCNFCNQQYDFTKEDLEDILR
ncbi:MAG: Hsp33 family molecular chaperone HslO [Mycoplasma sp.]|nr:Hsp33 family molecular chaperone HslO [Mycoplasma sp.]